MILLTACTKVSSNVSCGLLFDYDEQYQETVAVQTTELKNTGQYNETLGMINDYKKTRDSIRACRKHLLDK